jgi:ABC-type Mn2+/Zn2+ transport system ATPase subunit
VIVSADLGQPERPDLLLEQIRAGYDDLPVLLDVSATLLGGQAAVLLGPNGSGKSTLLKVVLGLLRPWSGRVEVFGQGPDRLNRRRWQIGYVPQLREVDRAFPASVFDVAMMGRVGRLGLLHRPNARDRELVLSVLERVGLGDLAGRPFGALSGGQQQRVFLARALAQEPDLLVLDEPVAGVDSASRRRIGELLDDLRQSGVPLVVATHDIDELEPLTFDEHWTLAEGRLFVDLPGAAHEPHAVDRHEEMHLGQPASRRPDPFGLRPRATRWG